ncbi:MAG TPA: ribonuclease E inhibitor RraB, partial [Pseudomonas sp.]|nr:ribonuclease E inhibitor RraB [Pseudomonas sp.]
EQVVTPYGGEVEGWGVKHERLTA